MNFFFRCALRRLLSNQNIAPKKVEKLLQILSPPEFFFVSRLLDDIDRTTFFLFLRALANESEEENESHEEQF